MIRTGQGALDHLRIKSNDPGRYFDFPGIGPVEGYLNSKALESYSWSSAPFLSDTEYTTLQNVRRQFISSKQQTNNQHHNMYRTIRPIGRYVDPKLFDIFSEAYINQIGWTPEPEPKYKFMPYTLESVRASVSILGKPYSEWVKTDKDFNKLSSDEKDQMCEEEISYRTVLKIINNRYMGLFSQAPSKFRIESISETIRNHEIYQLRKHLIINYSKTAFQMNFPWYVHSHVDRRDRLVYAD